MGERAAEEGVGDNDQPTRFSIDESKESEKKSVSLQPQTEKRNGNESKRSNNHTSLRIRELEEGVPQGQRPIQGDERGVGLVATGRKVADEKVLSNDDGQLSKTHIRPVVVRKEASDPSQRFNITNLTKEQENFIKEVRDEATRSIFPVTIVNSAKEFVDELGKYGLSVTENFIENDDGVTTGLYLPDVKKIIVYPQGMLSAVNGNVTGERGAERIYQETIYHEGKAHLGLKTLLGNHFDDFCDKVWKGMSVADREDRLAYHWNNNIPETDDKDISKEKILKALNINKPNNVLWNRDPEHQNLPYLNQVERNEILRGYPDEMQNGAADEYVAKLAGNIGVQNYVDNLVNKVLNGESLTKTEKSIWNSFKDWLREFYKIDKLTDKEIAEVVKLSSDIFDAEEVAGATEAEREANRQARLRDLRVRAGRIRGGMTSKGTQKPIRMSADKDRPRGVERQRQTVDAIMDMLGKNRDSVKAKSDALKSLTSIVQAIQTQGRYDRATVDLLTTTVRGMLQHGLIENMSPRDVDRILGNVSKSMDRSVGGSDIRFTNAVVSLGNIVADNQLWSGGRELEKVLHTKTERVNNIRLRPAVAFSLFHTMILFL